jgi:hypothetical protein
MTQIRAIIVGVGLMLLAGSCNIDLQNAQEGSLPTMSRRQLVKGENEERLEGAWAVILVQRNGKFDDSHTGSQITFTGNQVTLQPNEWQESKPDELVWTDVT